MVSRAWIPLLCLGLLPASGQLVSTSVPSPAIDDKRPEGVVPPQTKELTAEMRGDILMARKMYREAAEVYTEAGAKNNAVLSNKLGIAYHQMMQFDNAKKQYQRAIKLNPKYAEAINNLGTIFYAQKKHRSAVSQYKKALRFAPESASIHSNLGTAEFARKRYQAAFDSYQRALQLDPEVFERRGSTGVLLQERSVDERAKFHYFLAKTYAKAGNTERALFYMRKAIEEGFKERNKFAEDPEFASMRELPEYQDLLKLEPRVL
jgi:tetratricopeptide (TPR) repeat protein